MLNCSKKERKNLKTMFEFNNENMILDESVKSDAEKCKNQMNLLYGHMLKYKYVKDNQLSSWVGTILNSCNEIKKDSQNKTNIKHLIDDDRNLSYKKGLEIAQKDNPTVKFPKSINDANSDNGNWFTFDSDTIINNPNFIKEFLIKNKSNSDSIEKSLEKHFNEDEYFRGK